MIGFLNVDKPVGLSSRGVVMKIQQRLAAQFPKIKLGHCGTLDPMASGVLILAVGRATGLTQWMQQGDKRYIGRFCLGQRSDSDDIEFPLQAVPIPSVPTAESMQVCLQRFIGLIQQIPPKFSAIRVGSKRAYTLARKGKDFQLPPRSVRVFQLELRRFDFPHFELDIHCGSGTYVRSLGRDIAACFQTAAVMTDLQRTATSHFRLADAQSLESILLTDDIRPLLIRPSIALQFYPGVTVDPDTADRFRNGLITYELASRLDQARLDQARLDQARLDQARLDQARLEVSNLEVSRLQLDSAAGSEGPFLWRVLSQDEHLVGIAKFRPSAPFERRWTIALNFAHLLPEQRADAG